MSLIAFGSVHGSPGVTTLTLLVAKAWSVPGACPAYVLEADPAGGVLAARYGLGREPGVVTLVARARYGSAPLNLDDDAQSAGGVPVVVAPESPDRLQTALATAADTLVSTWAGSGDVAVLADVGRLMRGSAGARLAAGADVHVWVTRPELGSLQVLAARIGEAPARRTGVVLVTQQPYDADRVAEYLGVEVFGVLPDDRRGARAMVEGAIGRRAPLSRAARTLTERLRGFVVEPRGETALGEWAAALDQPPVPANGSGEREARQ